jgi:uncharacterized YigZ family protein
MAATQYTYKTIALESTAEFSDRGSKFIAFTYQVSNTEEIKVRVKKLKELHPKAVHFCYAWRLGFDLSQYRANDDGEPSGSAGRPILGQIDSLQLTNVIVIVVRYFGGVLLGVPGLINAYKTVAQLALTHGGIAEKDRVCAYTLKFDYTIMNEVMRIIKMHHCHISAQQMALFCEISIHIALAEQDTVVKKMQDLHGLEITATDH